MTKNKRYYPPYDVRNKSKIFSGDGSRDMWNDINAAETVDELKDALYFVCCRLQDLESKLAPIFKLYNKMRKYFALK